MLQPSDRESPFNYEDYPVQGHAIDWQNLRPIPTAVAGELRQLRVQWNSLPRLRQTEHHWRQRTYTHLLNSALNQPMSSKRTNSLNREREQPWGSPSPLSLPNVYMEHLEKEALSSASFKPKGWQRYVDNILVLWPHHQHTFEPYLTHLNSQHKLIQFTLEQETDQQIPFLDASVKRDRNELTTTVCCKKTHVADATCTGSVLPRTAYNQYRHSP